MALAVSRILQFCRGKVAAPDESVDGNFLQTEDEFLSLVHTEDIKKCNVDIVIENGEVCNRNQITQKGFKWGCSCEQRWNKNKDGVATPRCSMLNMSLTKGVQVKRTGTASLGRLKSRTSFRLEKTVKSTRASPALKIRRPHCWSTHA